MRPEDIPVVASIWGKAYLTNPLNAAALGNNVTRHEKRMRFNLDRAPGQAFVAKDGEQVVGAMKMVEWPKCQTPVSKMLKSLPEMIKINGTRTVKILRWKSAWGKLDPKEPHLHFGPFGVLPERQKQGIGSKLLAFFCEQADRKNINAYLETDKPANVRLYQHFGFEIMAETNVLGVPNWFMWRSQNK